MSETLLIGIGAQKSGTTWLSDYLRLNQPGVHQTLMKEVHFFDNYLMPQFARQFEMQRLQAFKHSVKGLSLNAVGHPENTKMLITHLQRFRDIGSPEGYLSFLRRGAQEANILCDITPDYALLDADGFKFMSGLHENIKLVFLLRNPADRYWSSLRFNHTHNPAFDIDANFELMLKRPDFMGFADYDRTLEAVLAHFPPEHLHVEFYEALFSDDAVRRFTAWLGVPFMPGDYKLRSNAARDAAMPKARRQQAVQAYSRTYTAINKRFAGHIPESWQADMRAYL